MDVAVADENDDADADVVDVDSVVVGVVVGAVYGTTWDGGATITASYEAFNSREVSIGKLIVRISDGRRSVKRICK